MMRWSFSRWFVAVKHFGNDCTLLELVMDRWAIKKLAAADSVVIIDNLVKLPDHLGLFGLPKCRSPALQMTSIIMISLVEGGALRLLSFWMLYEYLVLVIVTICPEETDLSIMAEVMLEFFLLRLVQCDRSLVVPRYPDLANLLH